MNSLFIDFVIIMKDTHAIIYIICHIFINYKNVHIHIYVYIIPDVTLYFLDFYFVACLLVQGCVGCEVGSTVYTSWYILYSYY